LASPALLVGPLEIGEMPWGLRTAARRLQATKYFYFGRNSGRGHVIPRRRDGMPITANLLRAIQFEQEFQR